MLLDQDSILEKLVEIPFVTRKKKKKSAERRDTILCMLKPKRPEMDRESKLDRCKTENIAWLQGEIGPPLEVEPSIVCNRALRKSACKSSSFRELPFPVMTMLASQESRLGRCLFEDSPS